MEKEDKKDTSELILLARNEAEKQKMVDFYIWMQENGFDHNIRSRVEKKADLFINQLNQKK